MLQVLRQAVVAVLPDGPVIDGALRQGDRQGLQGLHQPCPIWLGCCPICQVWQLAQLVRGECWGLLQLCQGCDLHTADT